MPVATRSLEEIRAELETIRANKPEKPERKKANWYGLVFCDPDSGYASIVAEKDGEFKGVWLGKTGEFIPYLKKEGIDGEDVGEVLTAYKKFLLSKLTKRNLGN